MRAEPEICQLPIGDNRHIVARLFASEPAAPRGLVIVAPATGVAQYHYDDFARWLTGLGYQVLTFDYEGMGLSLKGHVKHAPSDILSWAERDCPAVLQFAQARFPALEIIWVGHSVGGHLLGMMPDTGAIARAITVAAGTGTWWYNAAPTKRIVWFLWYFLVPVTLPLCGYFPGNRLGLLCDMPAGVIRQWRHWCLHEDYAVGREGDWLRERYARVTLPIDAIEFSDDDMMSRTSVDRLHGFFTAAPVTRHRIAPEQIGVKRIGHIGWAKSHYRALWELAFRPLL